MTFEQPVVGMLTSKRRGLHSSLLIAVLVQRLLAFDVNASDCTQQEGSRLITAGFQ